ncbi:hypothetical protein ATE92_1990 [Ulvibacter sp. MAR_2010_11]|uniref:helix-turn-helix transcriptional regulator n=1 Tax=Ulvibacter sp. MAR_2010_11 TaxID=1250229 RepID=UPI000C2C0536|nr:hypothetical protein [Ulvibacter sp. MAR_2010_11]PKA83822.1 hypothetical protein ATE92_1990 [Ulvibacter sp. MAR_2010_11]
MLQIFELILNHIPVKSNLANIPFTISIRQLQLEQDVDVLVIDKLIAYSILGIGCLFFVILAFLVTHFVVKYKDQKLGHHYYKQKTTSELEALKQECKKLNIQLELKIKKAQLEKERLVSEIDQKNRSLSAKSLYVSERNNLFEGFLESLSATPIIRDHNRIKEEIHNLKFVLKTDTGSEQFLKHFEDVNPMYLAALKQRHPKLNANDMRYLSYVYMNLTSKEIASILNITSEASRKRRERISKKMGIGDSVQLYKYLIEINASFLN